MVPRDWCKQRSHTRARRDLYWPLGCLPQRVVLLRMELRRFQVLVSPAPSRIESIEEFPLFIDSQSEALPLREPVRRGEGDRFTRTERPPLAEQRTAAGSKNGKIRPAQPSLQGLRTGHHVDDT